MTKILVDLLPPEFRAEQLKRTKFYKIQTIGVAAILLTTFLASMSVALAVLQNQRIGQIQNRLNLVEQKVSDLKSTQADLLLLKNRLATINQYLGTPSQQSKIYQLMADLLPAAVSVSSLSVDKNGEVFILAVAPDNVSLDNFISNLTSRDRHQDQIQSTSLETISRGRDGVYRLSVKIKSK